jgi:arsenate reductase
MAVAMSANIVDFQAKPCIGTARVANIGVPFVLLNYISLHLNHFRTISMTDIYHNSRCSKSRQTLALLEENNITPNIIDYLNEPPSADALKQVLSQLNMNPRELLRKGEAVYKELGLKDTALSDDDLVDAMINNPKLIERPIVIHNGEAKIGRPPESVLSLF